MTLFLMRHGPAEDRADSGRDFDRRLTPRGREVVLRVIERFAQQNVRPDRILSSPYLRAKETAELVAAHLSLPIEFEPMLSAELDPEAVLASVWKDEQSTMLVGHDPWFSEIASRLAERQVLMGKGMIVAFDADADGTRRERFRIVPA